MNPLIMIGGGVVALIIMGMTVVMMISGDKEKKRRTMSVIKGRGAQEPGTRNQRDEQDRRRAEIARKLKEQGEDGDNKDKKKPTMKAMLEQAGLSITVKQYWTFSFALCAVFMLLGFLGGQQLFVVLMLGITGLLGIPRYVVRRRIKKRQKKFLEEFPDALEAMVRLLKAGMPVTEAISMAGREFHGPVGDEMTRIYEAQKVGIPLPDAALQGARRMPITEMQMFATGIAIQAQTGASLSEVLMNLAGVIRSRFRLKRKVQALSSEAKASAMIIGCLPFLVGGGMWAINPDYIGILFDTFAGRCMLVGGGFWMSMGIFIMKAMINFKV